MLLISSLTSTNTGVLSIAGIFNSNFAVFLYSASSHGTCLKISRLALDVFLLVFPLLCDFFFHVLVNEFGRMNLDDLSKVVFISPSLFSIFCQSISFLT